MFRSTRIILLMIYHYVTNTFDRNKYSVSNKTLDKTIKKQYREKIYAKARSLSRRMMKIAQTEICVKGLENLPAKGPVVYMVTHKSVFDIPIIATLIEEPIIFIGKKEAKKLPIVSGWFNAMGCIYLDRENVRKSLESILQGIEELKEGQSIVIFPEGTRSKRKEMGHFKPGSFKLATKANVPIVPIALQDTYKILEEKNKLSTAKVYINIGKIIDVPHLTENEKKTLPKDVEQYVRQLLEEADL